MKTVTQVFYDLEFTQLAKDSELISIGLVASSGETFYAESNEWNVAEGLRKNPWLVDHVMPNLSYANQQKVQHSIPKHVQMKDCRLQIARELKVWFAQFDIVYMWGDVQAYDWMHLCDLFGGAISFGQLVPQVYYIPFDLATRLREWGMDPDINREALAGIGDTLWGRGKHNALQDASVIKACWENTIVSNTLEREALAKIQRITHDLLDAPQ